MLASVQAQLFRHPMKSGPHCHSVRAGVAASADSSLPRNVTWLAGGFCLHNVEATLLGTLQARAAEQGQLVPLIHDAMAPKILRRLGCAPKPEPIAGAYRRAALRSATIDRWGSEFLADNPGATVVDLGVGLNTRFERIDDGRGRWIEIDLPRVIQLRNHVTTASARRQLVATSIIGLDWLDAVAASPGPHCFIAEALLGYVAGPMVRWLLDAIAARFAGAIIIFDTHPKWVMVAGQLQHQQHGDLARQVALVDAIAGWSKKLALRDFVPLLPRSMVARPGIMATPAAATQLSNSSLTRWMVV